MSLGPKIRSRRRQLGLTLQATADKAGISKPFLSQVERDQATPSITSLSGIARALGVSIQYFVEAPHIQKLVRRSEELQFFTLDNSPNKYARLTGSLPGRQLEGLLVRIPPNTRLEEVTTHSGEELFYVLQGELHLEVEEETYELNVGDSAHYLSTRQHRWENRSDQETVLLWIGTPALF